MSGVDFPSRSCEGSLGQSFKILGVHRLTYWTIFLVAPEEVLGYIYPNKDPKALILLMMLKFKKEMGECFQLLVSMMRHIMLVLVTPH